jgi:RNA polymerase sigma-70 factor (ECF subfamily)
VVSGDSVAGPRQRSDSELIDAFEAGERAACEELYDRLISVVEATLFRIMGRRDDLHEDLVQSAFEQIVLTLSNGRFARACSLASWASSVTTHVAFNTIRKRIRERKVVDHARDAELEGARTSSAVDLERDYSLAQTWKGVRRHLAEMNADQATTLVLHDVLGHDLAEIAVLTSASVAAAQSRLVRGRKDLQDRLRREAREAREARTPRGKGP